MPGTTAPCEVAFGSPPLRYGHHASQSIIQDSRSCENTDKKHKKCTGRRNNSWLCVQRKIIHASGEDTLAYLEEMQPRRLRVKWTSGNPRNEDPRISIRSTNTQIIICGRDRWSGWDRRRQVNWSGLKGLITQSGLDWRGCVPTSEFPSPHLGRSRASSTRRLEGCTAHLPYGRF